AIVVGHIDNYRGPAVFWKLGQLQPGDVVEIDRADGTTVKFKVEAIKQFSQDQFPTAEVYGNIDHAGLRLITCGGQFNRITRQYSDNTVVFASMVQ
ncbi:class F sortase, partial [Candidatus Microgenomates bacterium]|nr:class F sortase [Candidatus Microgenomates bacterium]